jgi:hypothetical protein
MPRWKFVDCDAMIGASLVPPPAPLATVGDLLRETGFSGERHSRK